MAYMDRSSHDPSFSQQQVIYAVREHRTFV